MGWFGKKDASKSGGIELEPTGPSIPPAPESIRADELALAVDTLSGMLRVYGEKAFDLEDENAIDIKAMGETWAQHVLGRAPSPAQNTTLDQRRDWAGVRKFFIEHREAEGEYVPRALGDLRDALNTFVTSLGRVMASDEEADGTVVAQLDRLRNAAEGSSTEALKREALSVADALVTALTERKRKQRAELSALGEKLHALGSELDAAKQASSRDALTGLLNRGAFDDALARTHERAQIFDHASCLLMLDADRFKSVNDTYGHTAGDLVLKAIADTLSRTFLRKNDFIARFGGEEFAVILRDTNAKEAAPLAERIRAAIEKQTISLGGERTIKITVSVGAAAARSGETPTQWIERADKALYQAKADGRNRVVIAD